MNHEAIWAPMALLGFFVARYFPFELVSFGACPWRALTGVPCPTCVGTRAAMSLARMDVVGALLMNPLVALAGLAAALYVAHAAGVWLRGWKPWRPAVHSPTAQTALRVGVIAALLTNWIYLIAAGR